MGFSTLLVPDLHFQSHITATIITFSSATNNSSRASRVVFQAKREKYSFLIIVACAPIVIDPFDLALRKLASALQRAAASSSAGSGTGDEAEVENQGFAIAAVGRGNGSAQRQASSGAITATIIVTHVLSFQSVSPKKRLVPEYQRLFLRQ